MKRIAIPLLACLFAASPPQVDPADLVTIRVKGTAIDLLPDGVDVMASKPAQAARKLVAKGGTRNKGIPHSVLYKGVHYIFAQPSSCKTQGKHKFKDGDVVYVYHAESNAEQAKFAKKYKLTRHDTLVEREGSAPTLYPASPGYYVIVLTRQTAYTCPMHPQVLKPGKGRCPMCRMDFVPVPVYR